MAVPPMSHYLVLQLMILLLLHCMQRKKGYWALLFLCKVVSAKCYIPVLL